MNVIIVERVSACGEHVGYVIQNERGSVLTFTFTLRGARAFCEAQGWHIIEEEGVPAR